MKKMTCNQPGGPCNKVFEANTLKEIVQLSKQHGMEIFQKGDAEHLKAMNEMKSLMTSPDFMKDWFDKKKSL